MYNGLLDKHKIEDGWTITRPHDWVKVGSYSRFVLVHNKTDDFIEFYMKNNKVIYVNGSYSDVHDINRIARQATAQVSAKVLLGCDIYDIVSDGKHYVKEKGVTIYTKDGLLHRDGDLPAVIWDDMTQEYYRDGLHHRDGNPAIDGGPRNQEYFQHGIRHRVDGPAYITSSYEGWYINGRIIDIHKITNINFNRWPLSEDDQIKLRMMVT